MPARPLEILAYLALVVGGFGGAVWMAWPW